LQQAWSDRNDFFCGGKVRFYDEAGNLVLLPEEGKHQRAEATQQQAEANPNALFLALVDRLREMGEDPDTLGF